MIAPVFVDITLHTTSGSRVHRYLENPPGVYQLIGVLLPDGTLGPVPPPAELPPPTTLPDGRPIHPTNLDLSGLNVAPENLQTFTERIWSAIKDIPETRK